MIKQIAKQHIQSLVNVIIDTNPVSKELYIRSTPDEIKLHMDEVAQEIEDTVKAHLENFIKQRLQKSRGVTPITDFESAVLYGII